MKIIDHQRIDGLVPDTRGQRVFPTGVLNHFDPFVMLDHIGPSVMPANWRLDGGSDLHPKLHPHRGFETITFMFQGNMHHRDNRFTARPLLTNGSVQLMNAGRGIQHGGDMWPDDQQKFHEIQLWVNSPGKYKMSEPRVHSVHDADIPARILSGASGEARLRIVAGELDGITGPINTFADIRILHGKVSGEQKLAFGPSQLPEGHNRTMLYLLSGSVSVKGEILRAFQAAAFEQVLSSLEFSASDSEFLLLSGQSLNETIAFGGSFVMNTREEIQQVQRDYALGLF
ncbi:pirin family protein [Thalassomonas viridans]|uniref:Pirin family protein n=1 Tax=Thalassomonas viridans TaxID=137584 RepID=A0AAE9Z4E8_9GAMM|nr:pirin family protein [Thalassomonas viridans]WDE05869.1 pirin family protein [Thalassomonas viridans]